MSFAVGAPDGQLANLIVSKYAIPAVVIIQYAAQLAYPSERNPRLRMAAPLWDARRWKDDEPPASSVAARDDEETKEGDIEALVAAEERGKQQARDDDVEEGWNRFVAEQSGELA